MSWSWKREQNSFENTNKPQHRAGCAYEGRDWGFWFFRGVFSAWFWDLTNVQIQSAKFECAKLKCTTKSERSKFKWETKFECAKFEWAIKFKFTKLECAKLKCTAKLKCAKFKIYKYNVQNVNARVPCVRKNFLSLFGFHVNCQCWISSLTLFWFLINLN